MASHPNLIHIDDVETQAFDRGEMRHERKRLAAAGGARRVGLSHYRIPPGARGMPAHAHADEEEIFYVLSGSGLSWQKRATCHVRAGDCVVHPMNGEPHTMIAGDDGLEVLAYATGSETNITWLPHAKAWWMGPRWLPDEGPNPFRLEVAAGPLDVPEPGERLANVVNLDDVEPDVDAKGDEFAWSNRDLGMAAGSIASGLHHEVLPAGKLNCPPHCHSGEEEIFVVLDGGGEALLGDDTFPIRAGSVLFRPPGTGVAHALRAGASDLTYLAYGTRVPNETVYYPRSQKLLAGGVLFRVQPVDYWDGEI